MAQSNKLPRPILKKSFAIVVSIILLILSPILCLESLVRIVEHDEKEEQMIQQMKDAKSSGDSVMLNHYRSIYESEHRDRADSETIIALAMLATGIVFGILGLLILIRSILYSKT